MAAGTWVDGALLAQVSVGGVVIVDVETLAEVGSLGLGVGTEMCAAGNVVKVAVGAGALVMITVSAVGQRFGVGGGALTDGSALAESGSLLNGFLMRDRAFVKAERLIPGAPVWMRRLMVGCS